MNEYIEHQEFIPKSVHPEEMPEGIAVKYYRCWPNEAEEITTDSLCRILENLRSGEWSSIFLANDEDLEGSYMELESRDNLYTLQFVQESVGRAGEDTAFFSTYDVEYLDSNEESDIECSDGQSIILRKYTTTDMDSVMAAIEYFIKSGKLWNGIQWMKCWHEWIEEDK